MYSLIMRPALQWLTDQPLLGRVLLSCLSKLLVWLASLGAKSISTQKTLAAPDILLLAGLTDQGVAAEVASHSQPPPACCNIARPFLTNVGCCCPLLPSTYHHHAMTV